MTWSVPELVAHRGDPVNHRENTLPAVVRARQDGAAVIEVDIRVTADGVPVLLHDACTTHLWGRDRPVAEQTLAQLATLPASADAAGIPTLEQALAAAAPARLLLDLPDAGVVAATVSVVRSATRSGIAAPAYTGGADAMSAVRRADPEAQIRLTWTTGLPIDTQVLADVRPTSWNPHHEHVTPSSIAAARELGLEVTCWTVNDVARARELAALGVAAITSDRAAELRRALTSDEPSSDRQNPPTEASTL